ncbi:MAG: DEAD/DEAH box helicase, partial [Candidatus Cloacimonadaceae bacterium]|nr:DEAD/DEAH box helicase [Candidatus Cloacimonadaceae bacterium]
MKPQSTDLNSFITALCTDRHFQQNIAGEKLTLPRPAEFGEFPLSIRPEIKALMQGYGIENPWLHQVKALDLVSKGKNVVLASGVSSGKSLCYQLPILNEILNLPASRSFCLHPTKALAQDQHEKFTLMMDTLKQGLKPRPKFTAGIYDGDTPTQDRTLIRKSASVIFTNPDMLHLGILPNHSLWGHFLANLRFVVIDEVHIYRGVFGSQVANVLRRLRRLCRFYGSHPQFIFTSATLANSQEHCENLIEAPVEIVSEDHSPLGERKFFIFNPPMVDQELGIRRSAIVESVWLARRFLKTGCQAILFSETRRAVEILHLYLLEKSLGENRIRCYRGGYLAEDRRKIERELREHEVDIVVSTNALELGIDIGGLDAVFINGYPGTICATIQQSGRAGRSGKPALTILVATSNPLDQYICRHPEYLLEKNPEMALIDPNNPEILQKHLHCAICEMALLETESFGALEPQELFPYLQILLEEGSIRKVGNRYVGALNAYPAADISLRNMSSQFQLLSEDGLIGYVDEASAHWMTHPQAVYLHQGDTWIVNRMDFEHKTIEMNPIRTNYYTQASQKTTITLDHLLQFQKGKSGTRFLGDVTVTSQTVGFKKVRFYTQEVLGFEDLELPSRILKTVAWWISLSPEAVERIKSAGLWRNEAISYGANWERIKTDIRQRDGFSCQHCGVKENARAHDVHHKIPFRKFPDAETANRPENLITLCGRCHRLAEQNVMIQSGLAAVAYLIGNLAPLFVMCERKDIGVHSEDNSELAQGCPVIVVYDSIPGGIGLSRRLYRMQETLLKEAFLAIQSCPCESGCPG